MFEITRQHRELVAALNVAMGGSWSKFTIAIDGVDHAGKSTLARFIAWQLGMPAIEADMLLLPPDYQHDRAALKQLISSRHDLNRPVIVEGMCILQVLGEIGVAPDCLVYVETAGETGSDKFRDRLDSYKQKFTPLDQADFTFRREP